MLDKEAEDTIAKSIASSCDALIAHIHEKFPTVAASGRISGQRIELVIIGRPLPPDLKAFCDDLEENVAYPEIRILCREVTQ